MLSETTGCPTWTTSQHIAIRSGTEYSSGSRNLFKIELRGCEIHCFQRYANFMLPLHLRSYWTVGTRGNCFQLRSLANSSFVINAGCFISPVDYLTYVLLILTFILNLHFIEVSYVDELFDLRTREVFHSSLKLFSSLQSYRFSLKFQTLWSVTTLFKEDSVREVHKVSSENE